MKRLEQEIIDFLAGLAKEATSFADVVEKTNAAFPLADAATKPERDARILNAYRYQRSLARAAARAAAVAASTQDSQVPPPEPDTGTLNFSAWGVGPRPTTESDGRAVQEAMPLQVVADPDGRPVVGEPVFPPGASAAPAADTVHAPLFLHSVDYKGTTSDPGRTKRLFDFRSEMLAAYDDGDGRFDDAVILAVLPKEGSWISPFTRLAMPGRLNAIVTAVNDAVVGASVPRVYCGLCGAVDGHHDAGCLTMDGFSALPGETMSAALRRWFAAQVAPGDGAIREVTAALRATADAVQAMSAQQADQIAALQTTVAALQATVETQAAYIRFLERQVGAR